MGSTASISVLAVDGQEEGVKEDLWFFDLFGWLVTRKIHSLYNIYPQVMIDDS
jgi:hypothetical protein